MSELRSGVRRGPSGVSPRRALARAVLLPVICSLWAAGCGYTTRPGLASHLKTIYVKPFENRVDLTTINPNTAQLPVYRHRLEVDITNEVIDRFQFTGLLRPATAERAHSRLEGELVEFRRDALRFDNNAQVEEWRLNLVVNLRYYDLTTQALLWEEERLTGDTTYLVANESEDAALGRAVTDLARRIVERTVENW
jgi:hypothetical protein